MFLREMGVPSSLWPVLKLCLSSSVLGVSSQSPVLLTSLQSLYLVFLSSKQSFKGKLFILMRSDLIAFSSMVCDSVSHLKRLCLTLPGLLTFFPRSFTALTFV